MARPDAKAGKVASRRGLRPTGGLKALADARKLDDSLVIGPVQKHVMTKEARDLSRRQDIIHPSEMSHSDWCPRATYLRIKNIREGGEFVKESHSFQALNIFQHGHEVHDKWQRWLWEMGELWGQWHCHLCDAWWYETAPRNCPNCLATKGHTISYGEIPLSAEKHLLISGSADGGVPKQRALLEFKTVGAGTLRIEAPEILRAHTHKTVDGKSLIDYEGLWRGISRPFSAHQRQGQIYLYICKQLGLEFDQVIYIYESKFHQGAREFVVQRRESIIEPLLESADRIRSALYGGAPPPPCPLGGCKHCEPNEEGSQSAPSATRRNTRNHGSPVSEATGGSRPGTSLQASPGRRSRAA